MDNKKIGKLIADLRKKKGLTQQELGDIVGVGFRAVSKWERGITVPDISIINELSKILGITSDELLSGEISKENKEKKKMSPKVRNLLIAIFTLIITFSLTISYYNNKTYTYDISSTSDEYYVEGQVILHKNNIQIIINKLNFQEQELLNEEIANYEYKIYNDEVLIFGYSNYEKLINSSERITIQQFLESFRINYNSDTTIPKNKIIDNGIKIKLAMATKENKKISKEIKLKLTNMKNIEK